MEHDYINPDAMTNIFDAITGTEQEPKKARGIVPATVKTAPVSPLRKPSRNGKFIGTMEKE